MILRHGLHLHSMRSVPRALACQSLVTTGKEGGLPAAAREINHTPEVTPIPANHLLCYSAISAIVYKSIRSSRGGCRRPFAATHRRNLKLRRSNYDNCHKCGRFEIPTLASGRRVGAFEYSTILFLWAPGAWGLRTTPRYIPTRVSRCLRIHKLSSVRPNAWLRHTERCT